MKLPIKKLLVFVFARQGLSSPYQMSSKSESDMDLIILVLRKKKIIINIYRFLSISNSFPVYVHAVFHFIPPLEIHNLYFGKHDKGDKSYKFMLQVANFHR
jgi:hypothetical protein